MRSILQKISGKTITGLLVSALVILFQAFGVNIHDLAPTLSVAIANFANAAAALVGLGFALWGHIQLAKHASTLSQASISPTGASASTSSPAKPSTPPIVRSPLLPVIFAALGGIALCGPLTGCSTAQQQEFTTTAESLGSDVVSYTETLANMIQKISATAAKDAPAIEALAQQWGMLPSNSAQLATFNKVVTDVGLVGNDAGALNSLLTTISATGTVPAVATTSAETSHGVEVSFLPMTNVSR